MTSDNRYAEETQAQIEQWNHEIIELEARIASGTATEEQLRGLKQQVTELKSRRDAAQEKIESA